jgi:putative heme-binding domain-containing protein
LRKAALWVAERHPGWGDALADFFRGRLNAKNPPEADLADLARQLAQFARSEPIQALMASALADASLESATKRAVLQAMSGAGLKQAPPAWSAAVRSALAASDDALLRPAFNAARALGQAKTNPPSFAEPLLRIANDSTRPPNLRLEALEALPSGPRQVKPELFEFLCASIDPTRPVLERNAAAAVLSKVKLPDDELLALADTLKSAGPLEMARLLGAFEHSTNESVGLKLMSSLKDAKGLSSLRPDLIKTVVTKYPDSVREQAQELINRLNTAGKQQAAHLDELVNDLKEGDVRRGQMVFNSQKAACSSCHTIGYLGGKAGPDLTTIGQVRTERDLLESIVYPSASFVRSFEPYLVATKSDESYIGVLKKDAPDELVLATGPGAEIHIARADIIEMKPGTVSIMPAGLEQQLSKQELADLLAFLKSTKWGPQ